MCQFYFPLRLRNRTVHPQIVETVPPPVAAGLLHRASKSVAPVRRGLDPCVDIVIHASSPEPTVPVDGVT